MFRVIMLIALLSGQCLAQSKYEEVGNSSAVVFKTEYGSWTAYHVAVSYTHLTLPTICSV